jgi:hypothetical protein
VNFILNLAYQYSNEKIIELKSNDIKKCLDKKMKLNKKKQSRLSKNGLFY